MANEDYEVGYGKPPQRYRFRTGQSGNPKGRPKGTPNFEVSLRKVAGRKVKVKDQNTKKYITKHEAIFTQLVNRAVNGDPRATALYIELIRSLPEEPREQLKRRMVIRFIPAKDGRPDYSGPIETMVLS